MLKTRFEIESINRRPNAREIEMYVDGGIGHGSRFTLNVNNPNLFKQVDALLPGQLVDVDLAPVDDRDASA